MEALGRASAELCELVSRLPPGADYAALDKLLRDFSGEGPGRAETDFPRLNIPRADLLTRWVRDQPGPAATWLATRPPEEAAGLAPRVIDNLLNQQPEAVPGWTQALPAGAVRDRIAREAVTRFSHRDAATATTLAAQITEPGLRAKALDLIPSPAEK